MKNSPHINRRKFVKLSAAGALGISPLISSASNLLSRASSELPKVFLFSKPLQFLDYQEMSKVVKEIGFDGIDLTVRPKGHVLPENVTKDLPKATKAMEKEGLFTQMISSKVINANSEVDKKVLEVASDLGYSMYRTDWLKYPKNTTVKENLLKYKKQLKDLSLLNSKLGITGCYQNHAGNYLGAPIWDLKQVLEGISPELLGVQYDIMHATVEGAQSWQLGLDYIKPHLNSIVVKDFKWVLEKGKWKRKYTPMGEGMVDFDAYFKFLKQHKIHLPISLHIEYYLGGAEKGRIPTIKKEVIFEAVKKDLQFLKNKWNSVNG